MINKLISYDKASIMSTTEAKTRFGDLVKWVNEEPGREIVIQNRGTPMAKLVGLKHSAATTEAAVEAPTAIQEAGPSGATKAWSSLSIKT